MFRERAKLFNRLQFVVDILLTFAAFPLAYSSRVHLSKILPPNMENLLNPELHPIVHYFWMIGLATACWAAAASSLGLYRISMRRWGWEKVRIILESSILLWLFLGFLSFALKLDLSRPLIALFILYQALILTTVRLLVLIQVKRTNLVVSSKHSRNILIIGTSAKARKMGDLISRYSDWGLRIIGYVAECPRQSEAQ